LLWPECPPEESSQEITDILQGKRQTAFLVLDDAGTAVGFVEVSTRDYVDGCTVAPVGYVEGIYVRPEHRQERIGTALIRVAELWARKSGCTEIGSDTRLDDTRSIAFHKAVGFRETNRQVVFLKDIIEQFSIGAFQSFFTYPEV